MASTSIALTLLSPSPSAPLSLKPPTAFFTRTTFRTFPYRHIRTTPTRSIKTRAFDFSNTFFEEGFDRDDDEDNGEDPTSNIGSILMGIGDEEKEEPPCPPGLRKYETMAVLRPDMSEDQRLALTQKYEELLVAGGGMYVDVFNRGVIPLAYAIKRRNKDGVINTYLDGIYLLFTYFTKPESMPEVEETLRTDDSVIRFSSFKARKRKQ